MRGVDPIIVEKSLREFGKAWRELGEGVEDDGFGFGEGDLVFFVRDRRVTVVIVENG